MSWHIEVETGLWQGAWPRTLADTRRFATVVTLSVETTVPVAPPTRGVDRGIVEGPPLRARPGSLPFRRSPDGHRVPRQQVYRERTAQGT